MTNKRELTDPKLLDYQEKMEQSGNLLLSIINNVLDMAKIESGKMELDENYVKIRDVYQGVYKIFQAEAEKKGIHLEMEYEVQHEHVICDETKNREIFLNLISNAVKYTASGGAVTIRITELDCDRKDYVRIQTQLIDTGIGMSEEFLPSLFEAFARERNTTAAKVAGTGLGMPIIKKYVDMIEAQVKPFLNSNGAILPEFDGYEYEKASGTSGAKDTRDIKNLIEDIFDFTARAFLIPAVLVNGKVEGTADANTRFLTNCIDPICDQLQEEATRKRYGYDGWHRGDFIRVDSSSIIHFDLFENAANVEKLVGSGAYTINDVRRAANQAIINEPWADEHYMTLNISTMGQATRPLTQEGGEVE